MSLIFGMKLHLVDLYRDCSNYSPGAKNGPTPGEKSWKNLVNALEATVLVQSSSNLLRMIILTTSHSSSNMGGVESKTRSVGQIMEKPCEHSRATVLVQSSSSLLRMIILTISQSSLNMGEVGSKTRLVGQILEKPCKHSRDHSFGSIFIKLAQNEARVLVQSSSNLLRMIILTTSHSSSNMGGVEFKN